MKALATLLVLLAAGLAETAAAEEKAASAPQASISFAGMGSINDWRADRRQGLWVQDVHRQWYYASTMGPCPGLDFAQAIGFEVRTSGTLDRFSSIIVPHEGRCPLTSLVRSEPPPKKAKT
jgi:Family of unknown function (DUF6491)